MQLCNRLWCKLLARLHSKTSCKAVQLVFSHSFVSQWLKSFADLCISSKIILLQVELMEYIKMEDTLYKINPAALCPDDRIQHHRVLAAKVSARHLCMQPLCYAYTQRA